MHRKNREKNTSQGGGTSRIYLGEEEKNERGRNKEVKTYEKTTRWGLKKGK